MLLYDTAIYLLTGLYRLAALFYPKAKKWVTGRQNWRQKLEQSARVRGDAPTLWIHVSSLGEFEQGRPVIEMFRERFPDWRVALSFFSPSGYEIRKNYPLADIVTYLPADTPANARDFIRILQPDLAVFVKYDFWANYLFELKRTGCPTLLVSALFRPSQPFFRWYGGLWRRMLGCFSHLFVQDQASFNLLQGIGIAPVSVAGDTRIDRVLRLAEDPVEHPVVAAFASGARVLVAGSSWAPDEDLLYAVASNTAFQEIKWIIAPHEPGKNQVSRILALFPDSVVLSACDTEQANQHRVLVIDNIGMLNSLYQYGWVAYIGGGFGKGIHNTLEPAAFGLPVLFGPKYEKFEEARQFVSRGGAIPVRTPGELEKALQQWMDPAPHKQASDAVKSYLSESRGATEMVVQWIVAKNLHFPAKNAGNPS